MSTGTSKTEYAELIGDMAAEQLGQMEAERGEFDKRMEEQRKVMDDSAKRIIDKLGIGKGRRPEYSQEIKQIADQLTAFPKLVPVMQAILARFMGELEKRFDELAAEYAGSLKEDEK